MIKHNVSFVVLIFALPFVVGFCRNMHIIPTAEAFSTTMIVASPVKNVRGKQQQQQQQQQQLPTSGNLIPAARPTMLLSMSDDNDNNSQELMISESDQMLLGALGTFASLVTLYSEFTLKTTGCGLPAGPFGLVGLVEGLSYLGVTGIFAYSIVTKVKTVSWDFFFETWSRKSTHIIKHHLLASK